MSNFTFPLGALGLVERAVDRKQTLSVLDRQSDILDATLEGFRAELEGLEESLSRVNEPIEVALTALSDSFKLLAEAQDRATDEQARTDEETQELKEQVGKDITKLVDALILIEQALIPLLNQLFLGTRTAGGLIRGGEFSTTTDALGNVAETIRGAVTGLPIPTGACLLTHQVPFGWLPIGKFDRLYIEDFPELFRVIGVTYGLMMNSGQTFALPAAADLPTIPVPASGTAKLQWMIRA